MIFEKIFEMENLQAAWSRVRANRPGPGIDRVRWEDFEANLSHNLHMLQKQLCDEAYKPLPVSVFHEPKPTGKTRTIGISTIRDKVVQQAVALALGPHFEKLFLPCSYAYRPRMSALSAVQRAGRCIARGKLWMLKMDVEKFFDTMDHGITLELIGGVVDEKPVIRLVSRLLKAKIFREMGLFDNLLGSQQGSGLSPLLSNIYLYPVDKELWGRYKECYLRYSDDIAVFEDEREKLEEARGLIEQCLARVKLSPNEGKTSISHVSAGIVYLGFYMDAAGKGPAKRSIEGLEAKLSEFDKVKKTDNASEKLAAAMAALRGWYNYYKTLKPVRPGNVLSLIALVRLAKETGETGLAREALKECKSFPHNHPEICFQLGELYADFGMHNRAMREYALALELDPSMEAAKEKVRKLQEGEENVHQAIEKIQLVLHHNPHYREGYQKLAELYLQLGLYGFAGKAHQKALEIDDEVETGREGGGGGAEEKGEGKAEGAARGEAKPDAVEMETGTRAETGARADDGTADGAADGASRKTTAALPKPPVEDDFDHRSVDLDVFLGVFTGRRDAHARQWVDERGRWGFARVERPLKTRDIHAHLKGDVTLAVYPVTAKDTVNFIVFDVDTAKRVILESGGGLVEESRSRAHRDILRIKSTCEGLGLAMVIEDSGYKGRHGWVFFEEELPAARAIQAGREIMKKSGGPSEGMIWELFPMGKSERHLSLIKLPLGINRKNNRRCLFLNSDNHPIADQGLFLKTIKRNSPGDLGKVLDENDAGCGEGVRGEGGSLTPGDHGRPALSPALAKLVDSCKIVGHLVSKARDTSYLNHYERTCLLYTLGFAGEEGCKLLHKVISYCINYDYQYTQKQIERRKESPMSCAKIMENFPELAEALGCGCKFKLPPRSYPSPVLYLLESEIETAGSGTVCSEGGAPSHKSGGMVLQDAEPNTRKAGMWVEESDGPEEKGGPGRDERKGDGDQAGPVADHCMQELVPTLDFEKLFSEENLPEDDRREMDGFPSEPIPPALPSPVEDSAKAAAAAGYVEWEDGKQMAAGGEDEDKNEEKKEGNENPVHESEKVPGQQQAAGPAGSLTYREEKARADNEDNLDAWELVLDYLKLVHSREMIRCELETAVSRLDAFFDHLASDIDSDTDTDTFKTTMGSIRRVRKSGGKSSWIVTTAD